MNDLIKSAKKVFYENVINGDITSKSLFRFVSRFYNKDSSSILPSFTSASEITERFSQYFIYKIKTIRLTIDVCNVSYLNLILQFSQVLQPCHVLTKWLCTTLISKVFSTKYGSWFPLR